MANIMLGKTNVPPNRPRDGRHCDLCGCSQPAVRCDKCGCQIFCLSCDDMYHRHPKRRFHLRKAVDPTPPTPQARPVLPMKIANLPTSPGDPSKMPLPPPRKKKPGKSFFDTFRRRSPSSEQNSPPLPKKEYSWTDRLGNIKKFMSNRPLPPLPDTNGHENSDMPQSLQQGNHNLSFIHRRVEERPPQLPQRSMKPNEFSRDKENFPENPPGSHAANMRNGTLDPSLMNRNRGLSDDESNWDNRLSGNPQLNTLNRQNPPGFFPQGGPGFPGNLTNNMHQSSSATDLQNLEGYPGQGMPHPQYPHYPMNPHMPHFPYPMYHPQYPNYPQYFGASFANLASQPTATDGDFSDQSEASAKHHSSKKYPFRKRAKRSQSVMVDRMAYPGQYPFGPFGPFPPGYGPGPWGAAPFPMEAPPSPASSIRSLNRIGRTRRRKKMTSDDDEEFSVSSSPLSRPKSSSSERNISMQKKAPLATQTTSEEESEEDGEREQNRTKNEKPSRRNSDPPKQPVRRTPPDPKRMPSPVPKSPQFHHKKSSKQKQREVIKHSDSEELPSSPTKIDRRPPSRDSNADQPDQDRPTTIFVPNSQWQCNHCTFINPSGNRICQVCCKTAAMETVTLMTSRPASAAASDSRKQSLSSEQSCSSPEKKMEEDGGTHKKRDTRDMEVLNSALDEAEEEINRGLQELMKLKEDFLTSNSPPDRDSQVKQTESPAKTEETASKSKPVYKSSGKMRTSILDKLNIQPAKQPTKSTASTSTETQTGPSKMDRVIEARRPSTSSTYSDAYNSPTDQSPILERTVLPSGGTKNKSNSKTESSCQTQTDDLMGYLERKKVEEDAYFGRLNNGQGFQYGDRMDNITSPVPSMYDRGFGGGYGMMHRSHSRASLFTGRMNDLGPMDYGLGPTPMYRSVSRSSLTGDYSENRFSEFNNLRKPDYYLSMEELVERRRQESIRAQGLELVRMIREAEQQGFTADDIQVALTNCGTQNPMEWLQENWRNMVENVISLSTSYANDKKENDIGTLSENEARDALRMHKGNVWAAVTECVESRQRKFLELKARGKFSSKDITDALTISHGDVEAAYAKLTKSTSKPFLMRIWGAGEGVANQDGAMPMNNETFRPQTDRYAKDNTDVDDVLSDEVWDEDYEEDVDWEEDSEDPDEEEQGDLEDLRTCHDDLCISDEIKTPESDSEYADAFGSNTLERNMSSPSSDTFFVIPEIKQEKKGTGFLSKLAALRKEDRGSKLSLAKFYDSEVDLAALDAQKESKNDTSQDCSSVSDQSKASGPFSVIKNTISAIRDSVSVLKSEKKLPCATPERRTIIVKGQIAHESLSDDSGKGNVTLISSKPLKDTNSSVGDTNDNQAAVVSKQSTNREERKNVDKESDSSISKPTDLAKDSKSEGSDSKTNISKNVEASFSENKKINETSSQSSKSQTVVPSFQKQGTQQTSSVSDKADEGIQHKTEVFKVQPSSSKAKDDIPTHSSEGKDYLALKSEKKENSPKPSNHLDITKKAEVSQNIPKENNVAISKHQTSTTVQADIADMKSEKVPNNVNRMENGAGKMTSILSDKKSSEDPRKVQFEVPSESSDIAESTEKRQLSKTPETDHTNNTISSDLGSQHATQSTNKIDLPTAADLKNITSDSSKSKEMVSDAVIRSNKSLNSPKEVSKTGNKSPVHEQIILQSEAVGKINKENSNSPVSLENISSENNIEKPINKSLNTAVDLSVTNNGLNSQERAQTSSETLQEHKARERSHQDTKIDITKAKNEKVTHSTQNITEIQESVKLNNEEKNSTPNIVLPSDEVLDSGFTECPPVKSVIKDVDSRHSLKSGVSSSSISSLQTETIEMIDADDVNDISLAEKKLSSIEEVSSLSQTKVETNLSPAEQLTNTNVESTLPVSPKALSSAETELKSIPISSLEGDNNLTQLHANSSSVTPNLDNSTITEDKLQSETLNNNAVGLETSNFKNIDSTPENTNAQTTQGSSEPITDSTLVTTEKANETKRNTKGKPKLKLVKLNKKDPESSITKTTDSVEPSTSKTKDTSRSDASEETNIKGKQSTSDKASEEVSLKTSATSEIYPPSLIEVIKQIPVASSQPTEKSSSHSAKPVIEGQDTAGPIPSGKEPNVSSVLSEESQLSSDSISNNHTNSSNETSGLQVENEQNSRKLDSGTLVPSPSPQNLQTPVENIPANIKKAATEQNSSSTPVTATTSESRETATESSAKPLAPSSSDLAPVSTPAATSTASQELSSATTSNESNQHSKENADPESRNAHDSISESSDSPVTSESHEGITLQSEKTNNSEDKKSESGEDEESSDDSRGMTPPNPFDALRHRFEGLIDENSESIGPVRPQSPYRRMSFRSRKAAIALERTRDTSTEKPWFLPKPPPEIKKTVPKRTLKQQMEIERRVRKMVSDKKCRTFRKAEIVVQLIDMNFEEEEAIQAANDCSTLEQAISYLQQECLLCTGSFPVSHIISMVHCPHKACRECLRAYFTVQIRDRNIMELLCPFCNEPDIFDEDIAQDYFNHLDIMLKKLVDDEIHELFQRKLRDRVLMRDPNFKWCSQCSSGFIAMPNLKRLVCPDCNAVTCASCRRPWEREHQGISCEAFAAWKDAADPEAQTMSLAKLLTEDGIDCPRCHFRYALAKGGCMHFRCTQCQHDFCSGCSKPFKMGQKCGVSEFCAKLGLHAHHPRNCLFYLRDKEPQDLQRLLDLSEVKYDTDAPDKLDSKNTCQVMEQKETADGMLDDYCGKDVEEGFAGLCRLHYVEYLGQLVNKHRVDPIQIFENDDLELVLRRANIRLPPKRYRETDDQYREKLVKLIQEELPLDRVEGS